MTSTRKPTADQYQLALMVRCLVRLRCRQGESVVAEAVKEAAGLDWRFCQACGAEEPHDHGECAACGFFKARKTSYGA